MTDQTTGSGERTHRAGLLDIRSIIAALMGTYGVILVLMGLFADPETDKTGGTNANLWAGLAMLLVAVAFAAWARLRPVKVPAEDASAASS
ncbi:hypothetical protein NOMA109596_16525 [Nocardioides marinus]|uniref:Uncharacterized protein n=1 Tax=Nocardioides marinus TaxID=374514 RepID=A0A7Z0C445_9ACTN|nr:hypothetical protein [Nocardioides marinus]